MKKIKVMAAVAVLGALGGVAGVLGGGQVGASEGEVEFHTADWWEHMLTPTPATTGLEFHTADWWEHMR